MDGQTRNRIEHVLIDKRRYTDVLDVISYRDVDCNSDHYPVMAKIRGRLALVKNSAKIGPKTFNTKRLKEECNRERYMEEVANRISALEEMTDETDITEICKRWEGIQSAIWESAMIDYCEKNKNTL